ncbi:hypothetical protein MNV49_001284 [Pseudohyphozyma bogoriensis]|nr:hypothetical protein MNV49_001284 [Pseudohyphozyma bogoriensis]
MSLSPAQLSRAASAYRVRPAAPSLGPKPQLTSNPVHQALLRATRITFANDTYALRASRVQSRQLLARISPSPSISSTIPSDQRLTTADQVDEHILAVGQVAEYLRKNVVQGVRKDDGVYALRITEETERGDNDTIKAPSRTEARVMRGPGAGPAPGNEGVRRRRRAPKADAGAAPVTCCSAA